MSERAEEEREPGRDVAIYELDSGASVHREGGSSWFARLLIALGIAWLAFFTWFVSHAVGWTFVPQLLPHSPSTRVPCSRLRPNHWLACRRCAT
jgi:hypothetical protein